MAAETSQERGKVLPQTLHSSFTRCILMSSAELGLEERTDKKIKKQGEDAEPVRRCGMYGCGRRKENIGEPRRTKKARKVTWNELSRGEDNQSKAKGKNLGETKEQFSA
ncbi:hypothetical protein NDU88_011144 [Pleurodeles waltl]|uniref:Uncharacterized protein n=1 Tax=Pleurodeles waltl TaxID=8319 RepID=A0AAV7R055_PLEWA|nr:hypothetical protein NDU88_011144 [Pleurodeles waltl]